MEDPARAALAWRRPFERLDMDGTTHTVEPGDTLIALAARYGMASWKAIWDHALNAELRATRDDPQVLAVGDEVFIPPRHEKVVEVQSGRRHRFVLKRPRAWFRTIVRDELGEPMANAALTLKLAGRTLEGATDGEGRVELQVPAAGGIGRLIVTDASGRTLTWHLRLGHLEPVDKLSGVKARLVNLGFDCGPIDETLDAQTRRALRDFQIVYKLNVTAEPDEATRAALLAAHEER